MGKIDGKKTEVRGRKNRRCNNDSAENSSGEPGQDGSSDRANTLRTGSSDRSTANILLKPGAPDFGGMLSQLRQIKQAHLAYVKAHEARLEMRLKEAKNHERTITENMERLEQELIVLVQQASASEEEA